MRPTAPVAGALAMGLAGVAALGIVVDRTAPRATKTLTADPPPLVAEQDDLQPHYVPPVPTPSPSPLPVLKTVAPTMPAPAPVVTTKPPVVVKASQAPKAVAAPVYVPPDYAVKTSTLALDDTSRNRNLPTTVYEPTTPGVYPLIVFAHGYGSSPPVYDTILRSWASAGYVVAAPTFPYTNSDNHSNENDMVNEPADISFVITQVEAQRGSSLDLSHGVGVEGHSDGAIVALAVGFADKYRDKRVTTVGVYEGASYSSLFGSYSPNGDALLVAQSDADEYNSESDGQSAYAVDAGGSTRAFLQLYGAKHLPPYSQVNTWSAPVDRTTTAWFDLYLAHRTSDPQTVVKAGTVSGVSSVSRG